MEQRKTYLSQNNYRNGKQEPHVYSVLFFWVIITKKKKSLERYESCSVGKNLKIPL
jgi:hypothetical protein